MATIGVLLGRPMGVWWVEQIMGEFQCRQGTEAGRWRWAGEDQVMFLWLWSYQTQLIYPPPFQKIKKIIAGYLPSTGEQRVPPQEALTTPLGLLCNSPSQCGEQDCPLWENLQGKWAVTVPSKISKAGVLNIFKMLHKVILWTGDNRKKLKCVKNNLGETQLIVLGAYSWRDSGDWLNGEP